MATSSIHTRRSPSLLACPHTALPKWRAAELSGKQKLVILLSPSHHTETHAQVTQRESGSSSLGMEIDYFNFRIFRRRGCIQCSNSSELSHPRRPTCFLEIAFSMGRTSTCCHRASCPVPCIFIDLNDPCRLARCCVGSAWLIVVVIRPSKVLVNRQRVASCRAREIDV